MKSPFDKYCSGHNHLPRPYSPHLTVFLGGSWLVEHGEEQESSPRSEVLHDSRSSGGGEPRGRCCRCASAFKSPSRSDGAQDGNVTGKQEYKAAGKNSFSSRKTGGGWWRVGGRGLDQKLLV